MSEIAFSSENDVSLNAAKPARAFSVVLLIELWERFGYYGMQGVLLLFLVQKISFSDRRANLLWGAFAALTYSAPVLGGWVGDKVLGSRRAMVWGGVTLALGYFLLTLPSHGLFILYWAMGVISVGNGLFKPNAATLVRHIYAHDDSRLDAAFTLYYMAVNVGSTVSLLLTPWLKDHYGWHVAFAACCLGLVSGLINYGMMRHKIAHFGSTPDFTPPALLKKIGVGIGVLAGSILIGALLFVPTLSQIVIFMAAIMVIGVWIMLYMTAKPIYRPGLKMMYFLTLEGMLYFIFYQQMVTSLTLFTLRHIRPEFTVAGIPLFNLSAGQFQALNPIWIMILSPLLAWTYNRAGKKGNETMLSTKFLWGFAFVAAGFLYWWESAAMATSMRLSPWVMVIGYFLFSAGELLISGLGLAVMARYVPPQMNAFMTGSYFVMSGTAMFLGSKIANLAALPDDQIIPIDQSMALYAHLFGWLGGVAVGCLIFFACMQPLMLKWTQQHNASQDML